MKNNKLIRLTSILALSLVATLAAGQRTDDAPSLPPLDKVAHWQGLAVDNVARWRCTRRIVRDWEKPGTGAAGWPSAAPFVGVSYPAELIDIAGGMHPIPEQLQVAFRPFWLPAEGESAAAIGTSRRKNEGRPDETGRFRLDFDFAEAYADCVTYVSQDVPATLSVNGSLVGKTAGDGSHTQRGFTVARHLHPGANTIAIEAHQSGPAIWPLTVRTDVHEAYPVRAGGPMRWRSSLSAGEGWSRADYAPPRSERWTNAVRTEFSPAFVRAGVVASGPIWCPGDPIQQRVAYFRMPIEIAGLPNFGSCDIQADNGWELWVNGELAGIDKRDHMPAPTPVATVQIGRFLHPGRNVIGVKAYNYGGPGAVAVLPRVKISF